MVSLCWLTRSVPVLCLMIGIVVLCADGESAQGAETIRINGSGSALDMMEPMVASYRKIRPDVRIVMEKPLGSSGAIKALIAGVLDIAVSSKPLKPEEAAQGALAREYGKTPVLFVTHRNVHRTDISTREAEEIYRGKVRTWQNGKPLRLILRAEGDIDTTILRGLSPGMDAAITAARNRKGMIVAVTDPESNEMVAATPGALGASGLTSLLVDKPALNPLSLNGVKATVKTLASGTYPLAKEIRFVTTKNTLPAALKFLEFIYSAPGRALAEKFGVLVSARDRGDK
ncbi:substrate-binding domain-containing protein [Geobacter argillaceus]|uniref:Phosphate ABC transporter substrate-binding protein (PhoT family) n=1 Tax=Geobacter argillaceus TaxID=345631 RepID=A0A562W8M5_9BACT|nr:substrate-binding domain-containing protein [Geobacter argillaceus]TWJ26448.1 phosphate ABC transporter substrate-binding protein (PhoT family) [Geobacter argillaceus]